MHSETIMLQRDSREQRHLLSLCILRKQLIQCSAFCVASLIGASVGAAAANAALHALHAAQHISRLPALVRQHAGHNPAHCPAQRQRGTMVGPRSSVQGLMVSSQPSTSPTSSATPLPVMCLDTLLFTQLQPHANRMRVVLGSVCIQLLDDCCLLGCRATQAATQVRNLLLLCCQPWLRPQL